jgi:hypothetical protein
MYRQFVFISISNPILCDFDTFTDHWLKQGIQLHTHEIGDFLLDTLTRTASVFVAHSLERELYEEELLT